MNSARRLWEDMGRRPRLAALCACWVGLVSPAIAQRPPRYVATDIGSVGLSSTAVALNDSAELVGVGAYAMRVPGALTSPRWCAFYYKNGRMVNLDQQLGMASVVNAMKDIGTLGGGDSDARAINAKGQIIAHDRIGRAYLLTPSKTYLKLVRRDERRGGRIRSPSGTIRATAPLPRALRGPGLTIRSRFGDPEDYACLTNWKQRWPLASTIIFRSYRAPSRQK